MFYFHKVAYVQYLGEVSIFHTRVKKFLPLYNNAKIIKIDRDFPKLWSQMYCHLFMVYFYLVIYWPLKADPLQHILVYSIRYIVYWWSGGLRSG